MTAGGKKDRKERLGRGLGALLGEYLQPDTKEGEVRTLSRESISPNPLQPRKEFSPEELEELTSSIRTNGLLQPPVVRPDPTRAGRFQLIAGERRFRAVTALGWETIPVVVREVTDETVLVLALVENIQRSNLDPIEEAEGYRHLSETFGLSAAEIAKEVGKDRSTVANALRLLQLPPSVRTLVERGDLTAGHARALLGVGDPVRVAELAKRTVKEGWSVRKVESAVRRRMSGGAGSSGAGSDGSGGDRSAALRILQEELRAALGARVQLRAGDAAGSRGAIEIPFGSPGELERLFALLAGREVRDVLE